MTSYCVSTLSTVILIVVKKTVILTLHECAEGEELISSSIPNNVNVFVTANRLAVE